MNKFPYCHVFDGQVVRAAAPGIGETCDRILFASLYNQKYFPLHGEDKFPLWEGYIFESKIPLVVRIGLASRACGSGIGPSPSNSVQIHSRPTSHCGLRMLSHYLLRSTVLQSDSLSLPSLDWYRFSFLDSLDGVCRDQLTLSESEYCPTSFPTVYPKVPYK